VLRQPTGAKSANASPDQPAIFGFRNAIGFASCALHPFAVLHDDLSALIRDQSLLSEDM
jgi:hypothetical protein